jgi:CheY-like chemotaxis protein
MSPPRPIPEPAPTILVVDDVDTVLKATTRVLELEGYRVLTARDGIEALEVLQRSPVHAVVSDLRMPRMDGDALAAEVTARWPAIGMVFMTGYSESALRKDLPGPLLQKPFDVADILGALRRVLRHPPRHVARRVAGGDPPGL